LVTEQNYRWENTMEAGGDLSRATVGSDTTKAGGDLSRAIVGSDTMEAVGDFEQNHRWERHHGSGW
jgi:hypothetical protein